MAEVLEIDGITLRGQGFGAATRTGRYSMPSRRGDNLIHAGASGAMFAKNKPFEEGLGGLSLWAIGATTNPVTGEISIPNSFNAQRQAFETNMQTLMRFFTRGHRLSTIVAGQADGTTRRAHVEWKEWSEPEVQAGGTRAEWAISYTIPGVWWEDTETTSQSAAAGSALPKTLDLTSFSGMTGVIEDSVITVNGPITDPVLTDVETGAWVKYTGALTSGQYWVVDCGAWTSLHSSLGSVISATTHAGSYNLLPISNCLGLTNTPRLVLSGSGGGSTTNFSVIARRKWVHG